MNKIYTTTDIQLIRKDYCDFIEPKVRIRLNILIGFLLLREGETIDLNKSQFTYKNTKFDIGNNLDDKKGIINLYFQKDGKKNRVTHSNGKLNLPNLIDTTIYKSDIKTETYDSSRFIKLSEKLSEIIRDKIDISPTSYLESQKAYCSSLSEDEKEILSAIFPYNLVFQKKGHAYFYASTLASALNTPVCPYCNREFINSIVSRKNRKIIGPTFDHFFSQMDYPFLKLSFYNLIPSCTTCNSRLKNQIEFDFDHFLYPYTESYEGIAKFKMNYDKHDLTKKGDRAKLVDERDITISIQTTSNPIRKLHGDGVNPKKGNFNVFKTEFIYNNAHKDVAFDLFEKFQKIPQSQIESIYKVLKDQGKKPHEIYRFYFGNHLEEKEFNKRPLSRMTRDIVEQLELVYGIKIPD